MILTFRFIPSIEWYIIDWVSIVPLSLVIAGHILYVSSLYLSKPTSQTY